MDVSNAFSSINRSSFLHSIRIICPALAIFIRDRFRATATSKMERFVIIVNGWESFKYYHKARHLGSCSSPRSASGYYCYYANTRLFIIGRGGIQSMEGTIQNSSTAMAIYAITPPPLDGTHLVAVRGLIH